MSNEFEADLRQLQGELSASRADLLGVIQSLDDADLDRARRGGWTVAHVLGHVIQSEYLYGGLVAAIVGATARSAQRSEPLTSRATALEELAATREALLGALASATEENFYRLQQFGHDEYSVISVLENAANHDREHAEQIRRTLAS